MVILQYQLERNEVNFDFLRGGEILEKVIKYRCSECGELFDTPEKALAHEIRHERIEKANEMLNEGYTLKQINDECEIWRSVPEHLKNVNKDNCFKISIVLIRALADTIRFPLSCFFWLDWV